MRKVIDIPIWYKKNRIVELRKESGYNQTQVSEKIGCVLKTYQNYEQGHNYPTLEYASKLANLYNVSIDYLLGRSNCRRIEDSYISEKTGLDDNAIQTLKILKRSGYIVDLINFIMRDYAIYGSFLSNLSLYLDNDYDTPVHFDQHLQTYVESEEPGESIMLTNGEKTVTIGKKLNYEVLGSPAYGTIHVPVSILESHALHCIQKQLDEWKKEYKKGSD
ncbi:helix-turn-helix domain-containing protein [Clostridium sp. Marseille-P3244]|uniref:helix-turn-helix domain-containing protein n=1 Tax=Clostridium sp. Marseille-P3244 TaxID=1871020 RepID=UPI000931F8DA|nr:helix-turn-helix transcriptional regulator [Clostridium sp. Marseille-P3244]